MQPIADALREHYSKVFDVVTPDTEGREDDGLLHPSSLPFCPLRTVYSNAMNPERTTDFLRQYYTRVGHVIHELVQFYLGKVLQGEKKFQVLGKWYCRKCDSESNLVKSAPCPKCGSDREYVEIRLYFKEFMTGATDCILRVKTKSGIKYFILDYKTAGYLPVDQHRRGNKRFPYKTNKMQIEAYTVMAEETLGITISGWVLFYITRDNPQKHFAISLESISEEKKARIRRRLERYKGKWESYRRALKAIEMYDEEGEDGGLSIALNLARKNKLCPHREFYDKHVHAPYDPCPLHQSCFDREAFDQQLTEDLEL